MADKEITVLNSEFKRALREILARVSTFAENPAVAVAYSGGLDSSALLHLLAEMAGELQIRLFAFHIHHGISAHADSWLAHCAERCASLQVTFEARRVQLVAQQKSGVEEAARISRYAALGELCRLHRVPLLLTAHHLDDQAETVLMQLLRGSGVAGLGGMDAANTAPDLLGDASLVIGRPLLGVTRGSLVAMVTDLGLPYVEDESNADTRYARNALRHEVMPAIGKLFPGFAQRFARTAQHAQSAQRLLVDMAAQDLAACLDGACIEIARLRQFSPERIDNLLRYWFGSRGVRMPSTAWLAEMRNQLLQAKADAQLCVTHADCHIRRHRDRVYLTSKNTIDPELVEAQAFRWNGESEIAFPAFGGVLHFIAAGEGVAADWLRDQPLTLGYRAGGERLKLALNRPTRSLKQLCQALDIPAWERETLIIVGSARQALYASGIGMDCHHYSTAAGARIVLEWRME